MKKIALLGLISIALLNSCKEEDPVAPVVNIAAEDKGAAITFNGDQNQIHFDRKETFVTINGGVPPYFIESSDILNAFIKGDTLFYVTERSFNPTIRKITVSDNRGYNRGQFSFISSPETVDLRVNDGGSNDVLANVTGGAQGSYVETFTNPEIRYSLRSKELFFGNSGDRLVFNVDFNNGNLDPSQIFYIEQSYFGFRYFKAGASTVQLTYDNLGIPKSIEFLLDVQEVYGISPQRYKIGTLKAFLLELD